MGSPKKPKHNRSTAASSSLATQPEKPSTQPAGYSLSTAAAELSRVYSLAQPLDAPTAADHDLFARKHKEKSSGSHSHHHARRHAARKALSSLLHESGTSGHFGLGLGIQRRNFGLDLGVDAGRNEGGEDTGTTARLKQFAESSAGAGLKQIAMEVPRQLGRYLEGGGGKKDGVAVGVGVRTRGTGVGVNVGAGRGRSVQSGSEVPAPQGEAAPPAAPAPQEAPVPQPAPVSEPAPAPQAGEGNIGYSSNSAFSGHIRTGHGEYAMSAARESALRIPQQAFTPQQASAPQQALAPSEPAKPTLPKRYSCHICRRINQEMERCASCGHRLCIDCEWLMPIVPIDGATQEFTIYEDGDSTEVRDTDAEDHGRAESVYTPSEFEQENYVDNPDTPDLPPKVWARQAALAKAHYTTPQSPTDTLAKAHYTTPESPTSGSPPPSHYSTTPQSPSINSPPPSPVDLSHLSPIDYPEPLRLASSPVRPPGPKSRRVVRDNPFVVADLLSARPTRVRRDDSEAGIGSRDGQASPQPGQFLDRNLVVGGGEGEDVVQGPVWQTNKIPLPGFGAERHAAPGALEGEKIPVEKAPEPAKLDPVVSEALTTPVSKSSGNVAEGNDDPHHIPAVPGVNIHPILARCKTRIPLVHYADLIAVVDFQLGVAMVRLVSSRLSMMRALFTSLWAITCRFINILSNSSLDALGIVGMVVLSMMLPLFASLWANIRRFINVLLNSSLGALGIVGMAVLSSLRRFCGRRFLCMGHRVD
ncbi:hypothetical protein ACLOAV_010533 [Pseudogymnoascus australis]